MSCFQCVPRQYLSEKLFGHTEKKDEEKYGSQPLQMMSASSSGDIQLMRESSPKALASPVSPARSPSLPSLVNNFVVPRRYTDSEAFGPGTCFDDILAECWPALRKFIEDFVLLGIVEPALQYHVWPHIKFERCTLGDSPPRILGLKSHRLNDFDQRTVELAADLEFIGDEVDLVIFVETGVRVTVSNLHLRGTFCIQINNFLSELPLIAGLNVYFMNPPDVKVRFGGALKHIEGRIVSVQSIIEQQVARQLVVPHKLTVQLSSLLTYWELHYPPPSGILDVQVGRISGMPRNFVPNAIISGMPANLVPAKYRLDFKLGAEEWSSEWVKIEDGELSWNIANCSCSFAVDYPYGQSLIVELRCADGLSIGTGTMIGQTRVSVANLSNATAESRAGQTEWPIDIELNDVRTTVNITLTGVFRPLFAGSSPAEVRNLKPLIDGNSGILVVILDAVRDLGDASEGQLVECKVSVGTYEAETWRVPARRMLPEDLGEETGNRLKFLMSRFSSEGKPPSAGNAENSPNDIAWLLGLEEDKVAAISRGSVVGDMGYELRLRVRDPLKDTVTFELKRGEKRPQTIAKFTRPVREILSFSDWTLPLKERPFEDCVEAGNTQGPPKFLSTVQFLGVQPPLEHVSRGRFMSDFQGRKRTATLNTLKSASMPRDAVQRRKLTMLTEEDEEGDGDYSPSKSNLETFAFPKSSQFAPPPGGLALIKEDTEENDMVHGWCGPCLKLAR